MTTKSSPSLASPESDAERVAAGELTFSRPPTLEEFYFMRRFGRYCVAVEVRMLRPGIRLRIFHEPEGGRN